MGAAGVGTEGGGDVGALAVTRQSDGEIAAGGEDLGGGAGADWGAVLVEGDVSNIVDLVFDAPMAARERQQGRGVRLSSGEAGDGVGDFGLRLAGGLADAPSLDPQDLPNMGPGPADGPGVAYARILGGIG